MAAVGVQAVSAGIKFHWAINRHRGRYWGLLPVGVTTTPDEFGITVRRVYPDHPYVVANACRPNRDTWHNRIHHAETRFIATDGETAMEYGFAACGGFLVDPLYTDEPIRLCDCGKGDASVCPRCEVVAHPLGLTCSFRRQVATA